MRVCGARRVGARGARLSPRGGASRARARRSRGAGRRALVADFGVVGGARVASASEARGGSDDASERSASDASAAREVGALLAAYVPVAAIVETAHDRETLHDAWGRPYLGADAPPLLAVLEAAISSRGPSREEEKAGGGVEKEKEKAAASGLQEAAAGGGVELEKAAASVLPSSKEGRLSRGILDPSRGVDRAAGRATASAAMHRIAQLARVAAPPPGGRGDAVAGDEARALARATLREASRAFFFSSSPSSPGVTPGDGFRTRDGPSRVVADRPDGYALGFADAALEAPDVWTPWVDDATVVEWAPRLGARSRSTIQGPSTRGPAAPREKRSTPPTRRWRSRPVPIPVRRRATARTRARARTPPRGTGGRFFETRCAPRGERRRRRGAPSRRRRPRATSSATVFFSTRPRAFLARRRNAETPDPAPRTTRGRRAWRSGRSSGTRPRTTRRRAIIPRPETTTHSRRVQRRSSRRSTRRFGASLALPRARASRADAGALQAALAAADCVAFLCAVRNRPASPARVSAVAASATARDAAAGLAEADARAAAFLAPIAPPLLRARRGVGAGGRRRFGERRVRTREEARARVRGARLRAPPRRDGRVRFRRSRRAARGEARVLEGVGARAIAPRSPRSPGNEGGFPRRRPGS